MLKFYFIYSSIINLISFILFSIDKFASKHNFTRIPEIILLASTSFGGSYGSLIAMLLLRHKTNFKLKFHFYIGVIIALIVQTTIFAILLITDEK